MAFRASPRALAEGLLLLAIAALAFVRTADVREMRAVADASQLAMRTPDDFYRSIHVLGPEYPILERLRRDYPPGTRVAVVGPGRFVARAQRFWLALLPAYPIAEDAELVICPAPCAAGRDRVIARGAEFELVRRGAEAGG